MFFVTALMSATSIQGCGHDHRGGGDVVKKFILIMSVYENDVIMVMAVPPPNEAHAGGGVAIPLLHAATHVAADLALGHGVPTGRPGNPNYLWDVPVQCPPAIDKLGSIPFCSWNCLALLRALELELFPAGSFWRVGNVAMRTGDGWSLEHARLNVNAVRQIVFFIDQGHLARFLQLDESLTSIANVWGRMSPWTRDPGSPFQMFLEATAEASAESSAWHPPVIAADGTLAPAPLPGPDQPVGEIHEGSLMFMYAMISFSVLPVSRWLTSKFAGALRDMGGTRANPFGGIDGFDARLRAYVAAIFWGAVQIRNAVANHYGGQNGMIIRRRLNQPHAMAIDNADVLGGVLDVDENGVANALNLEPADDFMAVDEEDPVAHGLTVLDDFRGATTVVIPGQPL
jgi:hypothetical protein